MALERNPGFRPDAQFGLSEQMSRKKRLQATSPHVILLTLVSRRLSHTQERDCSQTDGIVGERQVQSVKTPPCVGN